jgi:hypothetical protein
VVEASQPDDVDAIYAAVSYFIVYSRSEVCTEEIIFNVLHNENTQAGIVSIKGDILDRVLFNVVSSTGEKNVF